MLHLTLAEGLPRLTAAFNENRLLIQQPTRPMLLKYQHGTRVCAIGAMLPDYNPSFEGRRITSLPLSIPARDLPALLEIQTQHDTGDLPRFVQFMKDRGYADPIHPFKNFTLPHHIEVLDRQASVQYLAHQCAVLRSRGIISRRNC
jgi:hypothetical protein